MSMFENDNYRWRETCFVLFDSSRRPKLAKVVKAIAALNNRFELSNPSEEDGLFDSLTVVSPDDFAGLDICYIDGAEVFEQSAALIEDMKKLGADSPPPVPWEQIKRYDARFDVLHFERVSEDDALEDEMLDPSTLLMVLEALARLTGGVAVDPQAGTFLSE